MIEIFLILLLVIIANLAGLVGVYIEREKKEKQLQEIIKFSDKLELLKYIQTYYSMEEPFIYEDKKVYFKYDNFYKIENGNIQEITTFYGKVNEAEKIIEHLKKGEK